MFNDDKVILATTFLKECKSKQGKINVKDNVVVIGGGDVAMDVVTSLKKIGVKNVTDVVYEKLDEFLASKKELNEARENNVTIIDGYKPVEYKNGKITFESRFIDSKLVIKADLVILAVGQKMSDNHFDLPLINKGEIDIKNNYQIGESNVFAVGDITKGDKTVVYSIRRGKEVAFYVDSYLKAKGGKK